MTPLEIRQALFRPFLKVFIRTHGLVNPTTARDFRLSQLNANGHFHIITSESGKYFYEIRFFRQSIF